MRGIPTTRSAAQKDREELTPEEFLRRASGDEASRDRAVNQETVLRKRFGIEEKRDYTLEELGDMFAVTRERIRQIEQKSLQILRNPNRRKPLIPAAKEIVGDPTLN